MYTLTAKIDYLGNAFYTTELDNKYFTLELEETDNALKATLTAKSSFTMKELKITTIHRFSENDVFFANGYQSWTTSEEHKRSDIVPGISKYLKHIKFGENIASLMSDYAYTTYDQIGCFHSHTFTYIREKNSHFIEFYGSRTEKNGFTIFDVDMYNDRFTIIKDIDGLELSGGDRYEVFDIIRICDEYDTAFDKYFFDFCGFEPPKVRRLAGYTSWYNYFSNINEEIMLRDLNGLGRAKEESQIFQIDDGFESKVGDWLIPDDKKFPAGMKPMADAIHKEGYLAGIWLAPLCAQLFSKTARQHPDWLIKDVKTGRKLLAHFGWGGAYALDIYNAGAREYIRHFFDVILNDWGFDMVKLDFLFVACIQPRDGKTRGQLMCEAVEFLRECCGDKIILGCGVPLGACMGIFDACRIGCDAHKNYNGDWYNKLALNNEIPSSRAAMTNAVFRRGLNGRAFANDPDVFFLRDENIQYTLGQKLLLGKINDITGSIIFVSDNVGDYDERTLNYLKGFFKEKDYKVELAEYENNDELKIVFMEDGAQKTLHMNLADGSSNVRETL